MRKKSNYLQPEICIILINGSVPLCQSFLFNTEDLLNDEDYPDTLL